MYIYICVYMNIYVCVPLKKITATNLWLCLYACVLSPRASSVQCEEMVCCNKVKALCSIKSLINPSFKPNVEKAPLHTLNKLINLIWLHKVVVDVFFNNVTVDYRNIYFHLVTKLGNEAPLLMNRIIMSNWLNSLIHLSIHPLMNELMNSFIHSFIHSLIYSFTKQNVNLQNNVSLFSLFGAGHWLVVTVHYVGFWG